MRQKFKKHNLHWRHQRRDNYWYLVDERGGWGHVIRHERYDATGPKRSQSFKLLRDAKAFVERQTRGKL